MGVQNTSFNVLIRPNARTGGNQIMSGKNQGFVFYTLFINKENVDLLSR